MVSVTIAQYPAKKWKQRKQRNHPLWSPRHAGAPLVAYIGLSIILLVFMVANERRLQHAVITSERPHQQQQMQLTEAEQLEPANLKTLTGAVPAVIDLQQQQQQGQQQKQQQTTTATRA